MFEYPICNMFDKEIFKKQCAALEKHVPGISKSKLLHDVDDSEYQEYRIDGKLVTVCNDYNLDGVYIQSEIDLEPYFA